MKMNMQYIRRFKKVIFIILICLIFLPFLCENKNVYAQKDDAHIFVTWEGFEPDKCACVWFIKRFIDKEAEFLFLERGELVERGVAFDTPDAELRRYSDMSTFESIVKKYDIKDKAVKKIAEIIHDIEINTWGKKRFEATRDIIQEVLKIIEHNKSNEALITESCKYFDTLYTKFSEDKTN